MPNHLKAHAQVHLSVVLWGFTAVLGRLITLPAFDLVFWRMLAVAVMLVPLPAFWRRARKLSLRTLATYAGIGVLLAIHWMAFYSAVKSANASVAVSCIALSPALLSMMEPWLSRRSFSRTELFMGLLTVPGVMLVVGAVPADMHNGLLMGASAALLLSLLNLLNKRYVHDAEPWVVTAIELGAGALFLGLLAPWAGGSGHGLTIPAGNDIALLLVLAGGCTLAPFILSLMAMRQLSAFSAQLAVNLEPVYAIVLAILLLDEQRELAPGFYLGTALIVGVVLLNPFWHRLKSLLAA